MPVTPLIDLEKLDLDRTLYGLEEIRQLNPHRYEFEMLDAVVHHDPEPPVIVGYKDARADDFWVRGHIPGSPIFPGALMVESAAQLSSFCFKKHFGPELGRFFGFGGIEKVKFRGMVRPGQRFWVVAKGLVLNRRYSRFVTQGVVEDRVVFEGEIIGVNMPVES